MWKVDPKLLCRQHLLGEHLEMHMFAGAIRKGKSLAGFVQNGLVETDKIESRHDELAAEMERRGFNHTSPLQLQQQPAQGKVDKGESLLELFKRCHECCKRMEQAGIVKLKPWNNSES